MLRIRYIFLSLIFISIILVTLILFNFDLYFESLLILGFLSILFFLIILRFYKFYSETLFLLKKENLYIKNTVISFFLNPHNEYLRYKVAFQKKIEFYDAETEHHDYYNQNKSQSYCQFVIRPKIKKFENLLNKLKLDFITILMNLKIVQEAPSVEKTKINSNDPKCLLVINEGKKISRNEKCEATGKKFKNCCGAL